MLLLLLLSGRGEVGHCSVTVVLFSCFLSKYSVTAFSVDSLQFLLYFAVVLRSYTTLSRCLLTQSSPRILGLPRHLFLTTFWVSDFLSNLSSPILSTWQTHFTQPYILLYCFVSINIWMWIWYLCSPIMQQPCTRSWGEWATRVGRTRMTASTGRPSNCWWQRSTLTKPLMSSIATTSKHRYAK